MSNFETNKVSRRDALKLTSVGEAGVLIGAPDKVTNFSSPNNKGLVIYQITCLRNY